MNVEIKDKSIQTNGYRLHSEVEIKSGFYAIDDRTVSLFRLDIKRTPLVSSVHQPMV